MVLHGADPRISHVCVSGVIECFLCIFSDCRTNNISNCSSYGAEHLDEMTELLWVY